MDQEKNKILWIGVLLVLLVATAPDWLSSTHPTSHYDAPWIYPGEIQAISSHSN